MYASGKLLRETYGDTTLDFFYSTSGQPYALSCNGTVYYYITNLQGDVMQIVNASGTVVASYEYDPYGNIISATGDLADINPLRYRGYVFDSECDLYYLQSRYYDAKVGRFLNADSYISTGQGLIGNNMFAYCNNCPIIYVDKIGTSATYLSDFQYIRNNPGDSKGKPFIDSGVPSEFAKEMDGLLLDIIRADSVEDVCNVFNQITGYTPVKKGIGANRIRAGYMNIRRGISIMIVAPDPTPTDEIMGGVLIARGFGQIVIGIGELLGWLEET